MMSYTGRTDLMVGDDRRTNLLNSVSWGAIFAGVAAALVIQLLINMLGIGVGAAALDAANTADNPTASAFSTEAAIWWAASGIIASFVGGVVAGRLCDAAQANTARWHGFVSWAATTLLLFYLLTSAMGGLIGGTFNALGSTLSGVGHTAASAVGGVAQTTDGNALEAKVKSLVNPNDAQTVQNDIMSYIRASVNGDQQAANSARDQAVNSLAKTANISPDEARTRITQAEQQYHQTVDQAKQKAQQAAEVARKATSEASIAGFVVLVVGAIAAWIGGGLGTPRRELAAMPTTDRAL